MPPHPAAPPPDPYQVLDVSPDATFEQITAAYRVLVRALHPDTQQQPADPARLAEVLAAYALLRDPRRRAAYDAAPPAPLPASGATPIPVRVRHTRPQRQPDIRVGPVRRHPG